MPSDGGLLCRELERFFLSDESDGNGNGNKIENVPLAAFDAYFAELLARRSFSSSRRDARDGTTFTAPSKADKTFETFADAQSRNTAFSFPGTAPFAHTATLRGGGTTAAMWMGGDRLDAGD